MITETINIGDKVKIRCLLPKEYFITLKILTKKAADEANRSMIGKDDYFLFKGGAE